MTRASANSTGVIDHLVKGDRKRRVISGRDRAQGISDQNDIDPALIKKPRQRIVVGGQHGYLLPLMVEALNIENSLGFFHGSTSLFCYEHRKNRQKQKTFLTRVRKAQASALKNQLFRTFRCFSLPSRSHDPGGMGVHVEKKYIALPGSGTGPGPSSNKNIQRL
jgi:hypothetical protein